MTRRFFGFLCTMAGAALVSGSCVKDPLSDLDATPVSVVFDRARVVLAIGGVDTVTAKAVDGRSTPLAIPVTYTACDNDIIVTRDTSYHPVPNTSVRFVVRALASGASCIATAAGGVRDTLPAGVLPTGFAGTLSSVTPQLGDTLTINSTTELKFDTATVAVTFGGGAAGFIAAKTADQLKVLVPSSTAAQLAIAGINVTYVPNLITTLSSTATVTQTGDRWGTGDTSYTTAPTIATPAAAATSFRMVTAFGPNNNTNCAEFGPAPPNGSIGPCVIYKFVLAAPTSIRFSADWNSGADVDIYACDNTGLAGCFESGGTGAGSSKPETITASTYAAGTHYFVIELFAGTKPTNLYVTITRP